MGGALNLNTLKCCSLLIDLESQTQANFMYVEHLARLKKKKFKSNHTAQLYP